MDTATPGPQESPYVLYPRHTNGTQEDTSGADLAWQL